MFSSARKFIKYASVVCAVVMVGWIATLIILAHRKPPTFTSTSGRVEDKQPDFGIAVGASLVTIANRSEKSLVGKDMVVYINGLDFHTKVAVPPIGRTVTIPLKDFVNDQSARFNPNVDAVLVLSLTISGDMGEPNYSVRYVTRQ
jgi:hypothetical protein